MTQLLVGALSTGHRPFLWRGTFDEVLPYIREAFARVMETVGGALSESVRTPLVTVVKELCEPDPARRGHPKNLASPPNQYSLERYVTQFDLMARKAEIGLF
jgi:eukaryotic-like serine/threonine-protein kinase